VRLLEESATDRDADRIRVARQPWKEGLVMKDSRPLGWASVAIAGIALAGLACGATAHASASKPGKVKAKQITCEEFLALGTDVQPRVVYWIEGYSKAGRPEAAEIDLDALERPVAMVVTECQRAPKATLWEKVKKYL
jgi:acid stress chaperone HdeA